MRALGTCGHGVALSDACEQSVDCMDSSCTAGFCSNEGFQTGFQLPMQLISPMNSPNSDPSPVIGHAYLLCFKES